MSPALLSVLLDTERLKYPYTGLYHFCLELGNALMHEKSVTDQLSFFLPASMEGIFGKDARYIKQSPLHKYRLPNTDSYQVWHSLHQGSDYFPFRRQLPVVLTIHDLNFLHQPSKGAAQVKKELAQLQQKINRAQHVVTISSFVLHELQHQLNLASVPTSVIYNGCNFSTSSPQLPKLIPGGPFLFAIGTVAAKKNFHVLPALLKGNENWLVIAGITHEEAYVQKIKQAAIRWGVADRLIFAGAVTEAEKQWYYQQCLAFVFPSLAEGFGMPVLEAMFFGKPVFLSTYTSLPEIGGSLAYYFTSFDAEDMQRVLADGLQHFSQASPQAALQTHAQSFSWGAAAKKYLDIYRQLA